MSGVLKGATSLFASLWESAPDTDWSGPVQPAVATAGQPAFVGNGSYFTLRLNEMRLRAAHVGPVNYVPVCLVIADYFYDGAYRSFPFVVSQDKMRSAVANAVKSGGASPIEMFDTLIVGPVPVRAPEFGMFVGLFRIERSDQVDLLLDVVGSLGTAAGMSALTAGLPLARTVYDGVRRLFGLGSADQLLGTRLGFSFEPGTTAQTLSGGHVAYTSLPKAGAGDRPFVLKDGRLARTTRSGPVSPAGDCDYALVAVEHSAARRSFEDLPFHAQFTALQRRLIETPDGNWKSDWLRLMSAIRASPDLTRPDTTTALASYRTQIDEELALSTGEAKSTEEAVRIFRGAGFQSAVTRLRLAPAGSRRDRRSTRPLPDPDSVAERQASAVSGLAEIAASVRQAFALDANALPDPDVFAAELERELVS